MEKASRFGIVLLILGMNLNVLSQETGTQENSVDASKPTNLYTQLNTVLEYQYRESGSDVFGARMNVQYAFNPDNLLLAEVPLLYNAGTEKFGLSDIRVRYFSVVKRNITKRLIAIAPYADITVPTGSFVNGLGGDVWSLSAGSVFGVALSKKVAMFPGAGYVYVTKPNNFIGTDVHGFNVQANMSVSFTNRLFLFVNPIFTYLNQTIWSGEFNFNYMLIPNKIKLNVGYFPNFTAKTHTTRLGVTFFI